MTMLEPPMEAAQVLQRIEQRVASRVARSREVVAAFFRGTLQPDTLQEQLEALDASDEVLTGATLGRFAACWRDLVPPDPDSRAQLCYALGRKYVVDARDPCFRGNLGWDDPALAAAAQQRYGQTPEQLLNAGRAQLSAKAGAEREHEDSLSAAEASLEWVVLPESGVLFRQGDSGDSLYIVVSGQVRVLAEQAGPLPRVIAQLGPGQLVGEMAVITGRPRMATVDAAIDSELVRLTRAKLDQLLVEDPKAMIAIVRLLVERLERREHQLEQRVLELTVEIDQSKRQMDVSAIAASPFFRDLQGKAGELRSRRRGR